MVRFCGPWIFVCILLTQTSSERSEESNAIAELNSTIFKILPSEISYRYPLLQERTIIALTLFGWVIHLIKSVVKPLRTIYLTIQPEIFLGNCLMEESYNGPDKLRTDTVNNMQILTRNERSTMIFYKPNINDKTHNSKYVNTENKLFVEPNFMGFLEQFYKTWNDIHINIKKIFGMNCFLDYCKDRLFRWLDG